MKIVEESPRRLVVEDRPWGLGLMLVLFILSLTWGVLTELGSGSYGMAAFLAGLAGLIFWAMNRYVALGQLVLDRDTGRATWRQVSALSRVSETWDLSDLRRAVVEAHRDEGVTYRITLVFENGRKPLPLTPYFSGLGRHEEVKARINRFLGAPEKETPGT